MSGPRTLLDQLVGRIIDGKDVTVIVLAPEHDGTDECPCPECVATRRAAKRRMWAEWSEGGR